MGTDILTTLRQRQGVSIVYQTSARVSGVLCAASYVLLFGDGAIFPPRGQPRKYNSTISAIVALFQPTALPFPNFSVLPTPFVHNVFQRCAPAAARRPLPLHLRVCRRGSPRYVNAARCGMRRTDLPADKICDQVSDAIVRVFAVHKKDPSTHDPSSSTPACARTRTPRLLARPRPRRA